MFWWYCDIWIIIKTENKIKESEARYECLHNNNQGFFKTYLSIIMKATHGLFILRCVSYHSITSLISIAPPLSGYELWHWICDIQPHLKTGMMTQFTEHCVVQRHPFLFLKKYVNVLIESKR